MNKAGTTQITLTAKAHNGKVSVHADIPVSGDADEYLVSIAVTPRLPERSAPQLVSTLDHLYGALADTPLPEISDDSLPEQRDEL